MRQSIKIPAFRLQGQAGEFTVGPALKKKTKTKKKQQLYFASPVVKNWFWPCLKTTTISPRGRKSLALTYG